MDSKNKNILIGGLLAIVLVMAVGYAAFATQLNIGASSTIDTTWDVHYDTTKTATDATTTEAGVIEVNKASTGTPKGSISFDDNLTANLSATLQSPGDYVIFTLTIQNNGSFDAAPQTPVVAWDTDTVTAGATALASGAQVAQYKHIKYTVTGATETLAKKSGDNPTTQTMTIKAEYLSTGITDGEGSNSFTGADGTTEITNNVTATETAGITVKLIYKQA